MNLDEARRKVLGWDKPVDKARDSLGAAIPVRDSSEPLLDTRSIGVSVDARQAGT